MTVASTRKVPPRIGQTAIGTTTADGGEFRYQFHSLGRGTYIVGAYLDADGKLMTESLKDFTRKVVRKEYASLDQFLRRWSQADKKQAVIAELEQQGVFFEPLAEEVGGKYDPFDLICHVAFGQPPLSRRERADAVKKRDVFAKYAEQARKVLEVLLDKYADTGIANIEDIKILQLAPFNEIGTAPELVNAFGGRQAYQQALHDLEQQIYNAKLA